MTIEKVQQGVERRQLSSRCRCSIFGAPGSAREVHLFVEPEQDGSFEEQLAEVVHAYREALATLQLPHHTAVFRRCFVSDAANQLETLMRSPLGYAGPADEPAAVSCIEQPPLHGRKLALMAYHVGDVRPEDKTLVSIPGSGPHARALELRRGRQTHLWTAQMTGVAGAPDMRSPNRQTEQLFHAYGELLGSRGATLLENVVRTWVFVQNVDANYQGMVDARRELFEHEGLTRGTHYIVSTGIEGRTSQTESLIDMDALAILGLEPGQMRYLECLDHLNRTDDYGVTFERGVRLDHADRSHLFLAGTASIDGAGRVLHEGDVESQVARTLENIEALLAAGGTPFDDVAAMIVYLRDPADAARVEAQLDRLHPGLPYVMVRAPVCRPTWLVEMEPLAITPNHDPRWPPF